jgi:DNA gyrase/topoisomerase IV subunit B
MQMLMVRISELYYLTLLARKLKPLFDEGRIFIAQPPLYKIKKGKTEKYISNDDELNISSLLVVFLMGKQFTFRWSKNEFK